jgi:hypothetical protein
VPCRSHALRLSRLQFDQFSVTLSDAVTDHQLGIREASRSLALTMSQTARALEATWPYFTLPHYESFVKTMVDSNHTQGVQVVMVVEPSQLDDYVRYTKQNVLKWMEEGHLLYDGDSDGFDVGDGLPMYLKDATGSGVVPLQHDNRYLPLWTSYPPPRTLDSVNLDLASLELPFFESLLALKTDNVLAPGFMHRLTGESAHAGLEPAHEAMQEHPHVHLLTSVKQNSDDPDSPVVAILISDISWGAFLTGLLPESVEGVDLVVQSNYNETFTYRIQGQEAIFLGSGDLHDIRYKDLEIEMNAATVGSVAWNDTSEPYRYRLVSSIVSLICLWCDTRYATVISHMCVNPFSYIYRDCIPHKSWSMHTRQTDQQFLLQ